MLLHQNLKYVLVVDTQKVQPHTHPVKILFFGVRTMTRLHAAVEANIVRMTNREPGNRPRADVVEARTRAVEWHPLQIHQ